MQLLNCNSSKTYSKVTVNLVYSWFTRFGSFIGLWVMLQIYILYRPTLLLYNRCGAVDVSRCLRNHYRDALYGHLW